MLPGSVGPWSRMLASSKPGRRIPAATDEVSTSQIREDGRLISAVPSMLCRTFVSFRIRASRVGKMHTKCTRLSGKTTRKILGSRDADRVNVSISNGLTNTRSTSTATCANTNVNNETIWNADEINLLTYSLFRVVVCRSHIVKKLPCCKLEEH